MAQVLDEERAVIAERSGGVPRDDHSLVGLGLSGGGIRSATFALGVMESLRRSGWLERADYLSTVSGGGYIGSWLTANARRNRGWLAPDADWRASIAHLRRYSNYLSPRVGFMSADTWSMVTVWLRNTILVQATVILVIALALLLPRLLFDVFREWPDAGRWRWASVFAFLTGIIGIAGNELRLTSRFFGRYLQAQWWWVGLALGATMLGGAWLFALVTDFDPFDGGEVVYGQALPMAFLLTIGGFALQPTMVRLVAAAWPGHDPPQQINYTQNWVQAVVVVPLMASAFLVAAVLWGAGKGTALEGLHTLDTYGALLTEGWRYWPFPLSVVFVSFWLLSIWAVKSRARTADLFAAFGAPLVAVAALHALLCVVMLLRVMFAPADADVWKAFIWGPPLVACAFILSIVVLIGMLGRQSTDDVREWWSRLGAWLAIYSVGWMVLAVTAVYAPTWVQWAANQSAGWSTTAVAGWVGTIAAGLFAGGSEDTSGEGPSSWMDLAKDVLARVAPFLFIAGLLVAVSFALDTVAVVNCAQPWDGRPTTCLEPSRFWAVALVMFGACFAALLLMAARVDINLFSLNAFYRNRLVRCYLGASRFTPGARAPQNFTGFDGDDDMTLASLVPTRNAPGGPLHIVNCALNLGGSSDLSLHTRRSASFTLSPLHCGSAYASRDLNGVAHQIGYLPTAEYGSKDSTPTLGQAVSVSGAAASPNMGYHTSPVTAFLLTLFNVRLGWWFPNPARSQATSASPWFSLRYLFAELFGGAHDRSGFVMVSDGGHFENLAAYELVRRRCGLVIVSDAECDPSLTFSGLGTLIRMCEVDFGVTISIDVSEIRRVPDRGHSGRRCVIGEIRYPGAARPGTFVYLKASTTGNEDTAVLQYKASRPAFPHESTGDQFYGEDQFESYRRLGEDVGREASDALRLAGLTPAAFPAHVPVGTP